MASDQIESGVTRGNDRSFVGRRNLLRSINIGALGLTGRLSIKEM